MSSTNNAQNVTAGKPNTGGAVYVAPLGTSLPASANASLNAAFKGLGYISDAGVTNSNSPSSTSIKSWGGDVVLDVQTEKPDTFKMMFLEATNEEVLKLVFGSDNVSGTLATGLTIEANSTEQVSKSMVIDMLYKDGVIKRVVLPNCKVTSVADVTYSDSAAVGYDVTLSCYPDTDGNTHYEYLLQTSPTL